MDLNQLRAIFRGEKADQIKAKLVELDDVEEKIAKLTQQRQRIDTELNELVSGITAGSARTSRAASPGRRNGVRDEVLKLITEGTAKTPSEIRRALNIANDDTSGKQSVSNALSALKKNGLIVDGEHRSYLPFGR